MPHQIFNMFQAYSLTASENRRVPYVKTAPTRLQRATHVKTAQNFRILHVKAVTIRITYVTYAKAASGLNLLVYNI